MTPMVRELPQDAVIRSGSHPSFKDGACAVEWVNYLAGKPHSDETQGHISGPLRAFVMSWNDAMRTDADRARLLTGVIPRLIDSASTPEVEERRSYLALDWLIRVHTPTWLDLVPSLSEHAAKMRGLAPILDLAAAKAAGPISAAAGAAAGAAARAAAWAAARDAAWAAAWAAAGAAAWAAAWDAARAAAGAAARAAAGAAARAAAGAAAGAALQPTVTQLEQSALDLLDRMLSVTPDSLLGRDGARDA